ncbi:MAG TPA: ATP-binding cassette domain-containing protein [Burkholderiales bacterium]|jgi:branched-chain amino acid transport system ATP-binding protein|nr:ATP-binding cassette domain-containing protein [Burkholderiales bacterium]
MSDVLLCIRGVSVRFGGLQALDDVSFDVRQDEILALIGPNGAGKSTLLNVVSGALEPDAGEILLGGRRLNGMRAEEVNALGLARTFQGAEVLRGMSVRENVMTAGAARCGAGIGFGLVGVGRAATALDKLRRSADRCLEAVGLEALAETPASTLTAGQQRLLAIGRALGTDAQLLILDEPGAGLNATEKAQLARVITRLRDAGKTVVFVEHDLALVGRLAERIVVLDHGKVIAAGEPDAVRSDPKVIEAYLGATEIAPGAALEANDEGNPVLAIESLVVRYGGAAAVDGASLAVAAGEIVAIVGANGAGKTTLLNAIAGSVRPASGRVLYQGRDISGLASADRVCAGLSLAPEGRQLFGSLSVEDNLLIGRYGRRRGAGLRELLVAGHGEVQATRAAINMVYGLFPKLRERASQAAATLSGGEGQMLAIGRALMNRPSLLLLDEPSFGLAPQATREILEGLPRLTESGVAVLLVEQNARAALQVSSRAYVLANGRVVAQGRSRDLLHDPEIARAYLGWKGEQVPRPGLRAVR